MVLYKLFLIVSLIGLSFAKGLPIEGSIEESKTKKWEKVECDIIECPRMIKKQHDGYAEVCFLGNPDWYKLTWMGKVINRSNGKTPNQPMKHEVQMKEAKLFTKKFLITNYYNELNKLNRDNMIYKDKGAQTFMANMFYVSDDTYQMEMFLLKPKLDKGDFIVPCNKAILSFFKSVETCDEMKSKFFSRIYKAPKCYYVLDSNQSEKKQEELRGKFSLANDQEIFVMLYKKDFDYSTKWYKTYEDLCQDYHALYDDEK